MRLRSTTAILGLLVWSSFGWAADVSCTRVAPGGQFPLPVIPGLFEPFGTNRGLLDLDGDGTVERFIVSDAPPHAISTLTPRGNGTIDYRTLLTPVARTSNSLARRVRSVKSGDTDGDGIREVIVTWSKDDPYRTSDLWLDVYYPTGSNDYRLGVPLAIQDAFAIGPMVGDFDGDDRDDVALIIGELTGRPQWLYVFALDPEVGWTQRTQVLISAAFGGGVIDFDGDGDDDLFVDEVFSSHSLRIHSGDHFEPLGRSGTTWLPFDPGAIFSTDLDGDGLRSLTMLSRESAPGNPTFYRVHEMRPVPFGIEEAWSYDLPPGAGELYGVWDANGDGREDVAFSYGTYYSLRGYLVLTGSGSGAVAWEQQSFRPRLIHAGRFDGDLYADAVVEGFGGVALQRGDASGRLLSHWIGTPYALDSQPLFTAGDLDGDGIADALVSDRARGLTTWRGTGAGSFELWRQMPSPPSGRNLLALRDIDADGTSDLIATSSYSSSSHLATIAFGTGDGRFAPPVDWFPNCASTALVNLLWGDLDADGHADAVVNCLPYDATPPELSYWLIKGRTATRAGVSGDRSRIYIATLVDVDGDGRQDLVGNAAVDPLRTAARWFKTSPSSTPLPPRPIDLPMNVLENWSDLLAGDLDHDGRADLVTGSGYGTGRVWRTFVGDGSGRFRATWENPLSGQTGDGVLIDLDGDGHLDLIEQYGIAVHRGDGTGGFFPAAVFLAPADQFTFARTHHGGPIDVIAFDRDPIVGGFVTAPQLGTIPAVDSSPPEPELIVRPVVHDDPNGRPAFDNTWRLAATAFDDCRSARVTAQRIDLLPTPDDAPLTLHGGEREEIRVYEFPPTGAREVHLFGPDGQAIRERFVRARLQGGFTLQQNAALAILTANQFGPTAGIADEAPSVIPNVQLTQRFVFNEGRLTRVEVHRPGGDLTATVEAIDEVGRRAATSLRFGAARSAYCGAAGAERIACEE